MDYINNMVQKQSFNILIIRVSSMGDVIHTLPAFFLLKRLYPHASISWLAQEKVAPLLTFQPFFSNIWILHDRYLHLRHLPTTLKIIKEIQHHQWDAILDFQGILKTSILLPFIKGIKIGFERNIVRQRSTTIFTHHRVSNHSEHIIQKNLSLASSLQLRNVALQKEHLNPLYHESSPSLEDLKKDFFIDIPSSEKEMVTQWLQDNNIRKCIILSPNTTWHSKLWPVEYWKELIYLLVHTLPDFSIIILGKNFGKPAEELATLQFHYPSHIHIPPLWNLATLSFLISHATCLIAPDTGLLHLADFIGTPTIGIFGPTLVTKHGPFLSHANKNNAIQILCSHRYQKQHTHANCMAALKPDILYLHIKALLQTS